MPYSATWHDRLHDAWLQMFTTLGWVGAEKLRFLEIGCFEGRATCWLLSNVLTGMGSRIDVVDTFAGSPEHDLTGIDLWVRFRENTEPWRARVFPHVGESRRVLSQWSCALRQPAFDFVYVDGSHRASDVLTDAVLAWPLLKPGGVLLFDDNGWQHTTADGELLNPAQGIQAFLDGFQGQYEPLISGGQIGVRKLA